MPLAIKNDKTVHVIPEILEEIIPILLFSGFPIKLGMTNTVLSS
jgi:hypothetical protein